MRDETPVVRAVKIYGTLLRLFPAPYREIYGPPMVQVFRDLSRTAFEKGGHRGMLNLWLMALPDLGKSAGREHLEVWRRWKMERFGEQKGFDTRWGLAVLAAAVLIAGGVLAKAIIIGMGGSIFTAAIIAIALNLIGAGIVEAITRTGGAVFGAVCILILAALLPLLWVPDSAAWLRENPVNTAIIIFAASYIYQRSKKRWVLFATALILGIAQIGVSFI
jgi:hypothetical protein